MRGAVLTGWEGGEGGGEDATGGKCCRFSVNPSQPMVCVLEERALENAGLQPPFGKETERQRAGEHKLPQKM